MAKDSVLSTLLERLGKLPIGIGFRPSWAKIEISVSFLSG
jgi:hypothetical protein